MISNTDIKKHSHIIYKGVDYPTDKTSMSGREIRSLVNFNSQGAMIVSINDIEEKAIADNEVIEIDGIIKVKEDPDFTRGVLKSRIVKEIELLEQNTASKIQSEEKNNYIYTLIKNYPLNLGWNRTITDILIILSTKYPNVKPDSFFIPSGFRLLNGSSIEAYDEPVFEYDNRSWGQFSYHIKTWNPSADITSGHNLITFVEGIKERLRQIN